jgi:fucose permease
VHDVPIPVRCTVCQSPCGARCANPRAPSNTLGLSCLEVAANPFIALAGPGELSEARLNFAQGIQGIGTIVSPIVAQIALFSGIQREDLVRVQWCYLAVALFVVFLAIVFYYVPLSEAGDDELEAMAVQRFDNAGLDPNQEVKPFGFRPRHLILWSGVLLMWCYDGSQESVAFFWTPIVADIKPNEEKVRRESEHDLTVTGE